MAADVIKRSRGLFGLPVEPRPQPQPRRAAAPPKPASFHSVSVAPGHYACTQARELKDRRFLSTDAPPLPLRGCGSAQCECTYLHHEDRRGQKRRARDLGVTVDAFEPQERRAGTGRGRRNTER